MRLEDPGNWGYHGKKIKAPKSKAAGSGGGCLVVLLATPAGTWAAFFAERLVF